MEVLTDGSGIGGPMLTLTLLEESIRVQMLEIQPECEPMGVRAHRLPRNTEPDLIDEVPVGGKPRALERLPSANRRLKLRVV